MNYLEIAQAVRILSGAQGVGPSSVVGASGYEAALVLFVKDAWIDIQNLREDWGFLEASKSFNTVVDKSNYSIADIFVADKDDFKVWKKASVVITIDDRKRYLIQLDSELFEHRYLNQDVSGDPTYYMISLDHSLTLGLTPGRLLTIDAKYFKAPQVLKLDTDIPILPIAYHNLIVYRALQKMSIYLGTPEIFRGYSVEADKLTGSLLRSECPVKRIKDRRRVFA